MSTRLPYELVAIDIDGTLADPTGRVRPATRDAVTRAAAAGVHVVLCSGRRYRRILPVLDELGLAVPVVAHSGALVTDPADHRTLWWGGLGDDLRDRVVHLVAHMRVPAVVYLDQFASGIDMLVSAYPSGNDDFDEYVEMNMRYCRIDPRLLERPPARTLQLCLVDSYDATIACQRRVHDSLGADVRTHVLRSPRYRGWMLEILRGDVHKWRAIRVLADRWHIPTQRILAIGDDVNDAAMLAEAGLGIVMGNAPDAVRRLADHVTGTNDQDGVAAAIDRWVLRTR